MTSRMSVSIALGLALAIGLASAASAARVGNNGGPGGPGGGPTGGTGTGHGAQDVVLPGSCKEWRYIVVDGVQRRECKIYNYNYSK